MKKNLISEKGFENNSNKSDIEAINKDILLDELKAEINQLKGENKVLRELLNLQKKEDKKCIVIDFLSKKVQH